MAIELHQSEAEKTLRDAGANIALLVPRENSSAKANKDHKSAKSLISL